MKEYSFQDILYTNLANVSSIKGGSSMNETSEASLFNGSKMWPYRHKYVTLDSLSSQKQWQLITNTCSRLNKTSLDIYIYVLNNAIPCLNLINTCITKWQ